MNSYLVDLLQDVAEFLEPYVDVMDGSDGPRPNEAMSLSTRLGDEIMRLKSEYSPTWNEIDAVIAKYTTVDMAKRLLELERQGGPQDRCAEIERLIAECQFSKLDAAKLPVLMRKIRALCGATSDSER